MNNCSIRHVKTAACIVLLSIFFFTGCATIGSDFNVSQVPNIQMNKTTQKEIQEMFGPPWRVGVDDGRQTWTYGTYHYSLCKEPAATDLVIRFNAQGVVVSYTYNTTEHK